MAKKKEKSIEWESGPILGLGNDPDLVDEGEAPEPEPENLDKEGQPFDQSEPFKVGDKAFLVVGANCAEVEIAYPENENGCFEAKIPAYDRFKPSLPKNNFRSYSVHVSRITKDQVGEIKNVLPLSASSLRALATVKK